MTVETRRVVATEAAVEPIIAPLKLQMRKLILELHHFYQPQTRWSFQQKEKLPRKVPMLRNKQDFSVMIMKVTTYIHTYNQYTIEFSFIPDYFFYVVFSVLYCNNVSNAHTQHNIYILTLPSTSHIRYLSFSRRAPQATISRCIR